MNQRRRNVLAVVVSMVVGLGVDASAQAAPATSGQAPATSGQAPATSGQAPATSGQVSGTSAQRPGPSPGGPGSSPQNAPTPQTGPAATAQYEVTLEESTKWQPYGGNVLFSIRGFDIQSNLPQVAASIAWKLKTRTTKQESSIPLTPIRIGETGDKRGLVYSVSIPLAWSDSPPDVAEAFPLIRAATIEVQTSSTRAGAVASAPKVTPLDIGITAKKLAAAPMAVFLILVCLLVYCFCRALKLPGGVVIRVISTANGWASLAQFQIVLWTILISAGGIYVMSLNGSLIDISAGMLVILGIAGGSVVGSQIKTKQEANPSSTAGGAPGAPATLALVDVSGREALVSWIPPSGAGEGVQYIIQFQKDSGTTPPVADDRWVTAASEVSDPRFRLTDLEPSALYHVRVMAWNAAGKSDPTPTITLQTKAATPLRPIDRLRVADGTSPATDQVWLSWAGDAKYKYRIEVRRHESDEDWRACDSVSPRPGLSKVRGLDADTDYDFRVTASDSSGDIATSSLFRVHTAMRVPRWSDIVTDTNRRAEIDVTRLQMLLFTVVSATFVALKIYVTGTIPAIPDSYVTLMGISNGVYLTAKFTPK